VTRRLAFSTSAEVVASLHRIISPVDHTWEEFFRNGPCASDGFTVGCPIGVNDLHIAAHAGSEGRVRVSNNLAEFDRVPGLLTESWVVGLG
jgi:predicted nucleic acid-binding protein